MKYSDLLSELLSEAKQFTVVKGSELTVEQFLLAVIAKVTCTPMSNMTPELDRTRSCLEEVFPNLWTVGQSLFEHLQQVGERTEESETANMGQMLRNAEGYALHEKKEELTADILVKTVISRPTSVLKTMISTMGTGEGTGETVSGKEPDESSRNVMSNPSDVSIKMDLSEILRPFNQVAREKIGEVIQEIKRIRRKLQEKVRGQDNAIEVFLAGHFRTLMNQLMEKPSKTGATYLFAGPPGVGKTFMAQQIAAALDDRPFKRFDMSEYVDKEANIEFCGSDKVYSNGKMGNVTSYVKNHPRSVLLFDEIEKAHINVIYLFLQILDAGILRDNYTDDIVSFKNTIMIFTTNAGRQLYEDGDSTDLSRFPRKVIMRALEKDVDPKTDTPLFPSAICSRFAAGNVVMFNHLDARGLCGIAHDSIHDSMTTLSPADIQYTMDTNVPAALMFSEGSAADARTVSSRAESFVYGELYELFRLARSEKTQFDIDQISHIRFKTDLHRASDEIRGIFEPSERMCVLVFAPEDAVERCRAACPAIEIIGTQTAADALSIVKKQPVAMVLLDINCGRYEETAEVLNIEDITSEATDFLRDVRELFKLLPIYLLTPTEDTLSDEEKQSFRAQGIYGVVSEQGENDKDFAALMEEIALGLHHQAGMKKLAIEHKIIQFQTAQAFSEEEQTATITLYNFSMVMAVEAEDAKNILGKTSRPDVHFEDVIGADEAVKELKKFVDRLKNPKNYLEVGSKPPKGVILYGPPGTGKTMMAQALACEANITFVAAEGNAFLKNTVGGGAEEVHKIFRLARKYAPSVLFIDEIDAVAKERTGHGNAEDTLTAFLTEMEGFKGDPSRPVFVLAATNFDVKPGTTRSLDPAFTRRFDNRIYVGLPKKRDRIRFLKEAVEKNAMLKLSDQMIDTIALRSTGMTLANLTSVIKFAVDSAVYEGVTVDDEFFEKAFGTYFDGEETQWDADQLERVARHEAGHALISCLNGQIPAYMTVVARSNYGGYVMTEEQEGKGVYIAEELLANIRMSLGGRAAEIACYGETEGISSGASGDLMSATAMARRLVCRYGMDDEFGLAVVTDSDAEQIAMTAEVRKVVNRILREQLAQAVKMITENRDAMERLVQALLEKNYLSGDEIESAFKGTCAAD